MKELDIILSDEFIVFSKSIAIIHEEKKKKKEELKKIYEHFQGDLAALDAQATAKIAEWETWKKDHVEKPVALAASAVAAQEKKK